MSLINISQSEERSGAHFSKEELLAAREQTWTALQKIVSTLKIGDTEDSAKSKAKEILESLGASLQWHKINIRFGPNTTKAFKELSDEGITLEENDIAYVDIGPVWNGFEGDAGDSIVMGQNERLERLASDAREIFGLAADAWKKSSLSGEALFRFCEKEATLRGWSLMGRQMSGHRLSDFPHAAYHRGKLADASYPLSPYAWVLEVTLLDPQTNRGAFFEDLLV